MPNQNEIKTTINIDANITNVEKAVGEIRKQMGQLQLGKGMQTSLAELYANFEQNFKRMRELTEGNELKLVDEKEFSKTAANISSLWDKLMKQVGAAGVDVKPLAKYQAALNNLNSQSKAYQKETKQAANDLAKAQQKQTNLEQNLIEAQKKAKALTEEKVKKTKAVADALKQQEEHQRAINKAEQEGIKKTQNGNYDRRYTTSQEANAAAAQLPQDAANIERLKEELQSIVDEINRQSQAVNKINVDLSNQRREVDQVSDSYKKIASDSITKIVQELQKVENVDWGKLGINLNSIQSWDKLKSTIEDLNNRGLKEAAEVMTNATSAMDQGTPAVRALGNEADKTSDELHHMSETGKEIDALTNRIKHFFSIGNAAMLFRRAIRSAYNEIKELDKAMTETAVVTNMTVGDLWKMLPDYTKRANQLGVSIQSVYEADTLYYQQGLKTNEVMAVSNETMKMARIAGLDAAEATDRMTNALRGFNMEITNASAQNVNDVYSQLAARTASNVDEISTAMTKVASLAHSANMEFENTAAFLAQIIETTRESAETAGTALKTVIARFSEVKNLYSNDQLMGTDEEGQEIDVNKVSTALRSAGINLNEYLTGAKGLDQIFIELSAKWDSLDIVQQRYIATMAAGSRQQSRFIALMQDYNRMTELTTLANNAAGASNEQFQKTQESLESMLNRLKNAWTEFLFGLANTDVVKGVIKILTDLLNTVNNLTNGFGPASKSILKFFAAFGTFKIGKSLFNNLFSGLSKQFVSAGKQAAASYESSLVGGIKKIKSVFTKDFWVGLGQGSTKTIQDNVKALNALEEASKTAADGANLAAASQLVMEESLKAVNLDQAQYLKLKASGLSIQQQAILLDGSEASQKALELVLTKGMEDAETKEAVAKALENKETKKGILYKLAENAQRLASTLDIQVENTWIYRKISAKKKENKVLEKNIALQWASLGVIGLIIAALVILVGAIIAVSVALANNTPEKQQERLAEATKQAAEAAQEAADNYNNLKDAIDNLDSKQQELNKLTKGTKEWADKVKEVNQAVLDLKTNYSGLELEYDEKSGILTINKESLNKAKKEAEAAERQANIYAAFTDYEETKHKYTITDKIGTYTNTYGAVYDLRASEDILRDLYKQYIDNEENFEEAKSLLKQSYYNTDLKTYLNFDYTFTEEKFLSYYRQLIALDKEVDSARNSFNAVIAANTDYSDMTEAQQKIYSRIISSSDTLADEIDSYADEIDHIYIKNYVLGDQENGILSYEEYFKNRLGDDFKEIGNNGKVIVREGDAIDAKKARKEYATYYKLAQVRLDTDKILLKIEQEKNSTIKALLSGNSLTKDQIETLKSNIDEIVTNYEGLIDRKQIEEWLATEEQKFSQSSSIFKALKLEKFSDKLTGEAASEIGGILSNALSATSNDELIKSIGNNINNIFSELGDEVGLKFIEQLSMIDLSSASIDNLEDQLLAVGIGVDELGDSFRILIKQLKEVARYTTKIKLDEQAENIAELNKFLSKISITNKTSEINEELYNQLKVIPGIQSSDFTYNLETGNYEFTGDINKLIEALEKSTQAQLSTTAIEEDIRRGKAVKQFLSENKNNMFATDEEWLVAAVKSGVISQAQFDEVADDKDQQAKLKQKYIDYANSLEANIELLNEANRKIKAATYQARNALYAVGENNEVAQDSLLVMARNTGMTDEEIRAYDEDWTALAHAIEEYQRLTDYEVETKYLASYAEQLENVYNLSKKEATAAAAANTTLNAGYKQLVDGFENWNSVLVEGDQSSAEYAATIDDLKGYLAQMLGVTKNQLPTSFVRNAETLDLLTKAAQGDLTAIDQLVQGYATAQILITNDATALTNDVNNILNYIGDGDFQIGDKLNKNILEPLFDAYLKILQLQEATNEEIDRKMRELFGSMRIGVTWKTEVSPDGIMTIHTPEFTYNGKASIAIDQSIIKNAQSKAETHNWLTGLDKYYNLTAAINEQLRKREKLERDYDRLIERRAGTMNDIRDNLLAQQASLRREIDLQRQLSESRQEQLKNAANEKIQWGEGYSTYAAVDAANYARWDENSHQVIINWDAIHAITNEDLGSAVEDYISKLEEYADGWNETEETIEDMEDTLYEINQRGKDQYLELEERVRDALIQQRQLEIDELQGISDQINDINSDIISGIQEQIDLERQIRDNTKKEEEINDMEQRLAYLQRDTSGANAVAIKELEENLENARQEYTDSLIDQTIQQMQDDNEKAQEQREKQIELMKEQLDWQKEHGFFNEQTRALIERSITEDGMLADNSDLMKLLQTTETFSFLSENGQLKWLDDMLSSWKEAMVGARSFKLEAAQRNEAVAAENIKDFNQNLGYKNGKWYGDDGKEYSLDYDVVSQKYLATAVEAAQKNSTNVSLPETKNNNVKDQTTPTTHYQIIGKSGQILQNGFDSYGAARSYADNQTDYIYQLNTAYRTAKENFDGTTDPRGKSAVASLFFNKWGMSIDNAYKYIEEWREHKIEPYATGGLNTSTGPAWLDGTTSRPEYVLNARDTQVYLTLTSLLNKLLSNSQSVSSDDSNGDNYFDININVEGIGSDYDVDQMIERVKETIVQDAQYRNVNVINLRR